MQPIIRIFDFKISDEEKHVLHQYIDQIIDEGHLTNHSLVQETEEKFKLWTDTKFALTVNNGSTALLASLQALKHVIPNEKRKIILPNNTFIACWLAVVQAGFEPVIMDSSKDFLGYDLNDLEVIIKKNDVAAVMVVHLGGVIDSMLLELLSLCKKHEVFVIEDAAHAHGSHLRGKKAGSLSDVGTFSFHLTKAVTCGEGGLISTNNDSLHELLISIRQFGRTRDNPHLFDKIGGNYKMSELQAAFLLMDLERAEKRLKRRQEIAKLYFEHLRDSSLTFIRPDNHSESSYYKCMALLPDKNRDLIIEELAKRKIQIPNGVYYSTLHVQPVVQQKGGSYPNSEKFSQQHICLPCYPELTDEQVHYFIESFKRCEDLGLV